MPTSSAFSFSFVLVVCGALFSCSQAPGEDGPGNLPQLSNAPPEVFAEIAVTLESSEEELAFEVAGRVAECFVEAGQWVVEGERLLLLEEEPLRAEVDRCEIAFLQARAGLAQAEGGEAAQLEQARRDLEASEQALERANAALQGATLAAPFEGRVLQVAVQAGDPVQAGRAALVLSAEQTFSCSFALPEFAARSFEIGRELRVRVHAMPNREHVATVESIEALAEDPNTAALRLILREPAEGLRPGMSATVHL